MAIVDSLLPHDLYGLGPLGEALGGAFLFATVQLGVRRLFSRPGVACEAGASGRRCAAPRRPLRTRLIASAAIVAFVRLRSGSPNSLGHDVMLVATAPLVYALIVFALSPLAFGVVQALALGATWLARRTWRVRILGPRLPALYVGVSLCLSLLFFGVFKMGPPVSHCRKLERDLPAPPVLGLEDIRRIPGLEASLPYDVVPSSDGRSLVVALKQTRGEPGGLVKVGPEGRVFSVATTPAPSGTGNSFPERIALHRQLHQVYALVYGPGTYHLFAFDDGPAGLRQTRAIPLPGEPISLYVDQARRQLWIAFAAEVEAGAIVYDLPGLEVAASTQNLESTQHMAPLDSRQQLLVATMSQSYKIAVLDRERKVLAGTWPYRWPLYGVTVLRGDRYAVASSPLTRSLVVFDPESGRAVDSIPVSGGLAELDRDPENPRVFVGDYAGTVDVVDIEARRTLATYRLGHMLRGLYFDAEARRLYAWSGCGVFALDPDAAGVPAGSTASGRRMPTTPPEIAKGS